MKILLLALLFLLAGCKAEKENPQELCLEKAKGYVDSMIEADLEKQMDYLEAFSLDKDQYWDSFLKYVKDGKFLHASLEHEDQLLIMIKLEFELELAQDFKENASLKPGKNSLVRYLSYYKTDAYRLKEILNKPIY